MRPAATARGARADGDDVNAFLPLAELATKGAYLYGVTNEGICYIIRGK